ncbi:hypothetical protein QBZ16_002965 [Prototheca wickerhamii]|uniref:CS domain-containing protein n=1 Tax=Prototheca wickerhamii TaxID=3111 RepID=A0AAD9MHY4_PROWI|nr:hypothetical protein QBZ16_002965 [Prototheca wickerhamii]
MDRIAPTDNHAYIHNGQKVYDEVTILIDLPPGVRAKDLSIAIREAHVTVGIKGLPPYLDVKDGILSLHLAKAHRGQTWLAAIAGHDLEASQQAEDQRRLMLERFQAEHPGFDFSQAEFNGEVPDPASFLKDI